MSNQSIGTFVDIVVGLKLAQNPEIARYTVAGIQRDDDRHQEHIEKLWNERGALADDVGFSGGYDHCIDRAERVR